MAMKSVLTLFLFVSIASMNFTSCKPTGKVGQQTDYAALGYKEATVLDYEVDGCIWMIQTADGKKYEPQNLQEEFRKDQQKVWVKFELVKNAMTICMGGAVIKLVDIKSRQ